MEAGNKKYLSTKKVLVYIQKELKIKACCIIILFVSGSRTFLVKGSLHGAGICLVLGSSCHSAQKMVVLRTSTCTTFCLLKEGGIGIFGFG